MKLLWALISNVWNFAGESDQPVVAPAKRRRKETSPSCLAAESADCRCRKAEWRRSELHRDKSHACDINVG
jgi:hypothetical protein